MKKMVIGALLLWALGMVGFAGAETRLMVVSDLHYMAPELYEGSGLFIRALQAGDGKLTQHSEELMAALVGEVRRQNPNALIVTGDLTFNGERASHEALADWFARIESAGVPVWVIPGNHDINVSSARGFRDERWYEVENVTPEEFRAIYSDFMQPPEGEANLSYAVRLNNRLWIAMTDVSFYQDSAQTFGLFNASHAAWLEKVLQEAGDAEVITATHHSLLKHTDFSRDSYLMLGHETMEALARRYGVRLNLSGHLHAQHIARADGLTDAALGAFCLWPHRYAMVTLQDDGMLSYEARTIGEEGLPAGFLEASRQWFKDIARNKTRQWLQAALPDGADLDAMADYSARFSLAYFSGLYHSDDPEWKSDPAYGMWQAMGEDGFWPILRQIMEEPNGDNLTARLLPQEKD